MKMLLHICCAPCTNTYIKEFKDYDITLFFYNPNIHPLVEYNNRLECVRTFLKDYKLIIKDEYDIENFFENIDYKNRCISCYKIRLEETFKYAKDNNYECVSTTLLTSIYQNFELIKEVCNDLSKKYNIKFIYKDIRDKFYDNINECKNKNMYMQKYCGCIFSKQERYLNKK